MAIKTLKGIAQIGGVNVSEYTSPEDYSLRENNYIRIDHSKNEIYFTVQDGPVKEAGVNGCQVDHIIELAKLIVEGLNKNFPCRENSIAITKLDEALMWLDKRTKDREKRGVEGTSQA